MIERVYFCSGVNYNQWSKHDVIKCRFFDVVIDVDDSAMPECITMICVSIANNEMCTMIWCASNECNDTAKPE